MSKSIWFDAEVHKACRDAYRKRIWRARIDFCKKHWSLLTIGSLAVTGAVALVFWRLSWMN